MNKPSQNETEMRIRSKYKEATKRRKNDTQRRRLSSSKEASKQVEKEEEDISMKNQENTMRLKKESEGKLFNSPNNFQSKETTGSKAKSLLNPTINTNNNILINNRKEIKSPCLKQKRRRPLKKKAKEKKEDTKAKDEIPTSLNEYEGQYTLRKRREDERIDFNLINCHQCHKIEVLNQMLTCRNERCKDSYCFNCIQKHYIKYASKLNLLTMRLSSWKCFKCKNECKCENCSKTKGIHSDETIQQKIVISIDPRKRAKKRVVRKGKKILIKKPKPIPKERQTLLKIHGITIVEIKENKQNALNTIVDTNKPSILLQAQPIAITDEKEGNRLFIPFHLNKREKLLQRIGNLCESINLKTNKKIQQKCLLCASESLQVNEILLFSDVNEFFDYLAYLFLYRKSTLCYNSDVFDDNVKEITKYSKKMINKRQWVLYPQIICKGCILIKLNQPKCLDYFISKLKNAKQHNTNLDLIGISNVLNSQIKETNQQSLQVFNNIREQLIKNDITKSMPNTLLDQFNNERDKVVDHDVPILFNDENSYYISKRDVNIFLNFNTYFLDLISEMIQISHLFNQDFSSNSLTLKNITEYYNLGIKVYQSYKTVSISYAQNQDILLNYIKRFIEYTSKHHSAFNSLTLKIIEIRDHFQKITESYIKLVTYFDELARSLIGRLIYHYQIILAASKENPPSLPETAI